MRILDTMRRQDAVYWAPVVDQLGQPIPDKFNQKQFESPVELKVYWMDVVQLFNEGGQSQEYTSKSKVYVQTSMIVGGMLFLGTLDNVPQGMQDQPEQIPGVLEIKRFDKIPLLRGSQQCMIAWL